MPERIAFLLGKDPALARGGDVTLSGLLREIAGERYDVSLICLSEEPSRVDPGVVRVAKPAVVPTRLAARSLATRRSLVHTRFDVDGLRSAVEASGADRFVAVHSYLAEPVLRAAGVDPARDLLVSTEVSEAAVWRNRGLVGRVEARRLARDEWRVARAARAIAGYDDAEMAARRAGGITSAHWLPLTLPPAAPVEVSASPPRLVLLGNRLWGPNAGAADQLLAWWPAIAAGIPDAELWLVGATASRATGPGVVDHGEVADVTPLLAACRALVAPVAVGGGVRVKVLEAAARGLPVVTTSAGLGPIERSLGVEAADGEDFVARCRTLLLDADAAAADGAALHGSNARAWQQRRGQDAVHRWLAS